MAKHVEFTITPRQSRLYSLDRGTPSCLWVRVRVSGGSRADRVIWPSGLINPVILRAPPVGVDRRPPNSPHLLSAWESSWDLGPIFADGAREPPSEEEIVLSPAWKIFQVPDPKIFPLGVGAKCVLGPREHFWPWNLGTLFSPNFSKCNPRFFYVALR